MYINRAMKLFAFVVAMAIFGLPSLGKADACQQTALNFSTNPFNLADDQLAQYKTCLGNEYAKAIAAPVVTTDSPVHADGPRDMFQCVELSRLIGQGRRLPPSDYDDVRTCVSTIQLAHENDRRMKVIDRNF